MRHQIIQKNQFFIDIINMCRVYLIYIIAFFISFCKFIENILEGKNIKM